MEDKKSTHDIKIQEDGLFLDQTPHAFIEEWGYKGTMLSVSVSVSN